MRMTLYTWDQTQETKEQNKDLFNVNVKAHLIWRAVLNNFSAQIAAFDCSNILEGNAVWLKKKKKWYNLFSISVHFDSYI